MEHDASLETTQPVSSISRISKVSTSPQPLQKKVRNSGISEDFASTLKRHRLPAIGLQIFPFIFTNMAAPVACRRSPRSGKRRFHGRWANRQHPRPSPVAVPSGSRCNELMRASFLRVVSYHEAFHFGCVQRCISRAALKSGLISSVRR